MQRSLPWLAALALASCSRRTPPPPEEPPPVLDRVVHEAIVASGRIALDDDRVTQVVAPIHGRVRALRAEPGERVLGGQTLALLADPPNGSSVQKAEAELVAARQDLRRQRELYELCMVRRDLEVAEDAVWAAAAELAREREKARRSGFDPSGALRVAAPIEGEILRRFIDADAEVEKGASLFTVANLDVVRYVADVAAADAARIRPGLSVRVSTPERSGRVFEGTVAQLSPKVGATTVTLVCTVPNPDHALLPDAPATAVIEARK